jgi:hypothetical protein
MNMLRTTSSIITILLLSCVAASTQTQRETWRRVFTGDEFIVDINPTSLTFEAHIFRAQFRTVFSTPEAISRNSTTKYKTRIETIEFTTDKHYRYYETSLLDSEGKTVQAYPRNSSRDWKVFKGGGVTERLYFAARTLSPLGFWNVVAYRYADGSPSGSSEPPDLARLIGTLVTLEVDAADIGMQRCSSPSYESHPLTDKAFFLKQGISLDSLGVNATEAAAIVLECRTPQWTPPRSLILPLASGNMLVLWKGVFLELKKQRH